MENAEAIISLIVSLVLALGTVITLICKLIPTIKNLIKEKNWKKIEAAIFTAAIEAEKQSCSGAEKKDIVLKSVEQFCKSIGAEFDSSLIGSFIDEAISFSNSLQKENK